MKKLLNSIVIIGVISFLSIGGCGGSSNDGCDFNFNGIINGPNFDEATSEWICNGGEFAFYQDGGGRDFSTLTTYQRVGCRTVAFQEEGSPGGIYDNLDGSISSGFLSFDRIVESSETFLTCTLDLFEEEFF